MAIQARIEYTPEEYLALDRKAEYKSEYVNGRIYAMSGASKEHNLIAGNVFAGLHAQLRGRPCQAYISDMRVKVNTTGGYFYPDVVAVCGEPLFDDEAFDILLNPTVVIEVLSDSTEAYDRGEKFYHYRRVQSLSEYVLVAQDKVRVEHYERQGEGWLLTEIGGLDDTLTLASLECAIPLRDIYERIDFPASRLSVAGGESQT
jgi:Uma2 family endonuclease